MKINKKDGLLLLDKLKLPTVKLISSKELTPNNEILKAGLSVRLSPKKNIE